MRLVYRYLDETRILAFKNCRRDLINPYVLSVPYQTILKFAFYLILFNFFNSVACLIRSNANKLSQAMATSIAV